jgi:predicted RNase H-like HicB family nuclease
VPHEISDVVIMSQTYPIEWEASTTKPHYSQFGMEASKIQRRENYRVVLEKGQDGWIVARCLNIKGAISQGKDREEALRNIVEAIAVILEDTYGEDAPEFLITWEEK